MKIIATADMHGRFPKLPRGDTLCISGDICPLYDHSVMYQNKWIRTKFLTWCKNILKNKTAKDIIICGGNHDWFFEDLMDKGEEDLFRSDLPPRIHYLRDSEVVIDGKRFWGTPMTPEFCDWAFNRTEPQLDEIFSQIPEGIDVLISHGPPYEYCDSVNCDSRVTGPLGSRSLIKHVKRVAPYITFAGHIHSGNHTPMKVVHGNKDINVVNVSLVNEYYKEAYPAFECEI